jgi:hypothetical protein
MKHKVHHGLDKDLAKKAMDKAIDSYTERFDKYNPEAKWTSEDEVAVGFSAKGVSVDGTIELGEDDMLIDLDVPFLLKPFKSKAINVIEEEINKWVAKAKEGELDDE